MKLGNNRLFPYPVLHDLRNDYKESSLFLTDIKAQQESNYIKINARFVIKDEIIEKYIQDNTFSQIVHIECSKTKYRKIFIIPPNDYQIEIKISAKVLNGNIEISPIVVCNRDINYSNSNFSEDYEGLSFELSIGSIVAFDDTRYVYIEKDKREYVNVPSVIVISQSKEEYMKIDVTSQEKIIIDLPSETYDYYYDLVASDVNTNITHQLIIYPAVVKGLEAIANPDIFPDIVNTKWFIAFKKQLQKFKISIESVKTTDINEKYVLAQKLLEDPVKRSFIGLTQLQGDD